LIGFDPITTIAATVAGRSIADIAREHPNGDLKAQWRDSDNPRDCLPQMLTKCVDALAGEAQCYGAEYLYFANPGTDYDAKVIGPADRAIALAPENMRAYRTKSAYLVLSRRFDESLRAADAGLAINPNYASLYGSRSNAKASLGRFEQAKSDAQQAMRLSPRDPLIGLFRVQQGDAELGLGHFDAAIDEYRNAIDSGYRTFVAYSNLAAAYALEGKMDEAKTALAEAAGSIPSSL
jgi:tetratricopeptide (TPR) repeat protein